MLLARGAGFDFCLVDMEHGPLGMDALGQIAASGIAAGYPVWGRVSGPASADLARVLDCGASGLIVPHVDSAEDARRIVRACRFAPLGKRSLPAPLPALDYALLPAVKFCEDAGRNVIIAAMIESAAGLEAAPEIAAVEGIDLLVIGTNDLADGLGLRGQPDHTDMRAAFHRVAQAAAHHGKDFGVMGLPPHLVKSHAPDATWIVATNDTNLMIEGGATAIGRFCN
ncbi:aldolase [Haematobacter missouriensis]|uniref:HpcH/HpaI aldolase family protein n=1 Tax=Haematobacter missouriensis TaxID=366616 RepID=UPI0004E8F337|nr:aldolase/citrate lyase family protein [Haematobacter missouriensis]KFI33492.1 aldolase [Haematobacter missouriensis]